MGKKIFGKHFSTKKAFDERFQNFITLTCLNQKEWKTFLEESFLSYGTLNFLDYKLLLCFSKKNLLNLFILNPGQSEECFLSLFSDLEKGIEKNNEAAELIWAKFLNKEPLELCCAATSFEEKILRTMLHLRMEHLVSYKQLSEEAGFPLAHRAAANVVANNPFPIIIPCHRIIYQNGKVGNYRYGSKIKEEILTSEERVLEFTFKD
ncbi:hypothetical protein AB751O23_AA_00560 [Chlamydiales bacterium SCGC AB-751-O23]|jgi:O-6-methylguanine DNA methyltransferase|nr:hypothetical protein AB751O23_AA_00560 [Chlamydiales bacterium SCGC AB-751-O23]